MKIITVVVVILFVFSLVSPVVGEDKMSPIDYSVKGKVVSLDLLEQTQSWPGKTGQGHKW